MGKRKFVLIPSTKILFSGGQILQNGSENDAGDASVTHPNLGTAEKARIHVHEYFSDLLDTIRQQENEALSVINTYVRGKLYSLRQKQEDMAVLVSQVSSVCQQCDHALQRSDAEVSNRFHFKLHRQCVFFLSILACANNLSSKITYV